MNRQIRTLIVLGVALLAAFAASYGVYAAISRIPVREVEVATRHAVVAARELKMGQRLTSENVKLVDWPAATPIPGGFDTIDAVVDRGLIANVLENEPIVETKVAPKDAGAGLPPSIPEGMRAMSVRVNEVIGVAGFVVPGTRVDVMVIMRQKEQSFARVVTSNIQVLTAGTRYDQENTNGQAKPIPSTVVTLLVTPEDAERIALAQNDGSLMLSLRNPLDTQATESKGVQSAALFGNIAPPPQAASAAARPAARRPAPVPAAEVPPPPPAPKVYTVEAIRAAKRSEEVIK
ncbi:MAG: Flp pilus assembly protein CpaB [Acidobacteriaceae bacterium]|jgi:pilus assembly protein CpaB|nr:Flp pilus assembly protein CpaB [Acidobacteriaceae bacterium]